MRVLIDIVHPAHVHFYRHLRQELLSDGHEIQVVARGKDVTLELLEYFDIDHVSTGPAIVGGLSRKAGELARRVVLLRREIKRFRPDIVLTRNPSGVQAAWLAGVPSIFDTDDGRVAGIHFWAAQPFADLITTPECLREDYGARHRRYRGFKAQAYLHPARFTPDPCIRTALGLDDDKPLFVIRFSAYTASHDHGQQGLSAPMKRALVDALEDHGHVLVSNEKSADHDDQPVRPDLFHHVLAAADVCIGDSQSVSAESAVLGTPAIRLSSFSGRLDCLTTLEQRYGLVRNFRPEEGPAFLAAVSAAAADLPATKKVAARGHAQLLAESVDVTAWYHRLVHEVLESV